MRSMKSMKGCRLVTIFSLAACMFLFLAVMKTEAVDDPAKQIERTLSKVKREIPTSPSRAEQGWLEASEMMTQLENTDPNHAKIPMLRKSLEQLGQALEKRLGRPAGGSSPAVKAEKPEQKQSSEPSGLPSSVASGLKKINNDLDAVEASLTKGRLQTAITKLKTAQKTMDEIEKRHGDKIPTGNEEMTAATDRLSAVSEKVNRAQASAAEMAAADAANQKQKEAQSQEWIDKFSPFLDSKSDLYLLMGAQFNSASAEAQEKCRKAYAKANALMAAYQKTEFPYGKTQALLFMEPGLTDKLKYFNEDEAAATRQAACKEWVETLRAYVDVGAGSRKYLVAGVTGSETEIKEREALFAEAQNAWSDYQKAVFPLGKTPELLQLEKDMQERLAQMPEALRQSRALLAGDVEGEMDRLLAHLNKDTGWKSDTSKTPNLVMKRDMAPLQEALARYAGTVDAGDAKLAALREKMALIEKTDQNNRAIRAERTFMQPDRYKGSDADALREKAKDIVKEKSASILRVTLPADDWKEEKVWEWTDTTKTASRYRVTKSMTAQVAAKGADGKAYLHSVHLASDRKSDGGWGALYGHIMWSDWMAEGNVDKR